MSKNFIFTLLILSLVVCGAQVSFGAEEIAIVSQDPIIYAPEGLEPREQASLERQYRYEFRNKGILEEPAIDTPFAEELSIRPMDTEPLTEQGELYRYFGIATVLYKSGRLEEAVEILDYIVWKKPNDEYVKRYLSKVKRELKRSKAKWRSNSRKDTLLLKKIKIKELIADGLAYYRQKQFGPALSKFSETLSLDPGNSVAKDYMRKLKKYYMKEVRVESIIKDWEIKVAQEEQESGARLIDEFRRKGVASQIVQGVENLLDKNELKTKGVTPKMTQAAVSLLDKAEYKKGDFSPRVKRIAGKILDDRQMENVVKDVKIASLMDDAELSIKIKEIITNRKKEERRKRSYTLGAGDTVRISVQDHPEISGTAGVGPNGEIMLPLVNEPVKAEGLTASEVQASVTNALKRYVKDPVVYVGITGYRSKIFYVLDETSCTPYNITRANFTLRDALFMSDWGGNRALGRVLITKPDKLHPVVKQVDAFDIVFRGNLSKNIRIEDGDVIYIPLTIASKVSTTISDALSPFQAIQAVREEWIDQRWNTKGWTDLHRVPRNAGEEARMNAGETGVGGPTDE